jgi:hypothetical protein
VRLPMREEERDIIGWLFDAIFGRRQATDEEIGDAIHRAAEALRAELIGNRDLRLVGEAEG